MDLKKKSKCYLYFFYKKYFQALKLLCYANIFTNIRYHFEKFCMLHNLCRQLLLDCGIGIAGGSCGGGEGSFDTDVPVVGQHRVLLFCQLKSMLDIVEKDLLK